MANETLDSVIDLVLGNVPVVLGEEYDSQAVYEELLKVYQAIEILVSAYDADATAFVTLITSQSISGSKTFEDIALGGGVTDVVGFWGTTPIVQPSSANQAALTNSTGGGSNGDLQSITGTSDDAGINNNFTELFVKLNEIRNVLVNTGLMKGSA